MRSSLFIKQITGTLILFAIIFISAGRLVYWQGLVYLFTALFMLILNYTVFRLDPELQNERAKPGAGAKQWDKRILIVLSLLTPVMYSIAGLDSGRFHWSPDFTCGFYASGLMLTVAGALIFLTAQKQNRFFSSVVRIQADRGHAVCDKGLYGVVRHPAYLGSIIQTTGFPLLFGSLWSIIPAALIIFLFLLRTWLEDKMLKKELSGYQDYSRRVPYRLIPYLW